MDTRDTAEQAELRRSVRRAAGRLGPAAVRDLDDVTRRDRLRAAVRDAGWIELRDGGGDGRPLAAGMEAAIVADALGGSAADVAFAGPLLARDLARRAGITPDGAGTVGFGPDLVEPAIVAGATTTAPIHAIDVGDDDTVLVLVPDGDGFRLARLRAGADASGGADLTRVIRTVAAGARVEPTTGEDGRIDGDDLEAWRALGLAVTSADLVGAMRGVLALTVAYASERRQFGVPVGSFQAVQHLLADAHCLAEGAHSASLHAAWAVDALSPREAVAAGRVAKAYAARAARTVGETAVQVHGGIGNTWECMAHVFLRRALLSSRWFGDEDVQLERIARTRTGGGDGLP